MIEIECWWQSKADTDHVSWWWIWNRDCLCNQSSGMLSVIADGLSILYVCIAFDSDRSRSIDTCWGLLGLVGVGWGLVCLQWQQVAWEFFMFLRRRGARNFNDPLCERSEHLEKFWGFSRGKMLTPRGLGLGLVFSTAYSNPNPISISNFKWLDSHDLTNSYHRRLFYTRNRSTKSDKPQCWLSKLTNTIVISALPNIYK